MARLPTVGGDYGNWGTVLNDYLSQSHKPDGSLRADVANIAELKALEVSQIPDKMQALVGGYYAHGDGGGGQFYYDAGASDADNSGTIIAPTAGAGRWKRIYSGAVNVKWFGAKGDGVADDTTAIVAAINLSGGTPHGASSIALPGGNFIVSSLDINANVNIVGAGREGTTITVTGFGTYAFLKYGVLLRGSGPGEGYVSLTGVYVKVQSTETSQIGILITKRALLTDVRVKNAPGDGIYLHSVNVSTETPYFSRFESVWSTNNGGAGIKITGNCNGCQFINCEANGNNEHGIHAAPIGSPVNLVNTQIVGGQASYNKKHGIFLENGWYHYITDLYCEQNSAVDGGNPVTGAYKNIHMGVASYSYVNIGGMGVATSDIPSTIVRNAAPNNFVGYGGHVLQAGATMSLGADNYGAGCALSLNAAANCQHTILFREAALDKMRIRYDGIANALVTEAWITNAWVEVQRVDQTGKISFFGAPAVAKSTVSGSRTDGTALRNLLTALASLGLISDSTSS